MSEVGNAFLRWVRLKQASKTRETGAAGDGGAAAAAPPQTEPAREAPFDPVSLPSIESIVADTDIVAFLRAGVPAELTRAALRRAWSSDPAIRDFIGIAENQWDFNDPASIPGFGALAPMENTADAFAQISSRLRQLPNAVERVALSNEIAPPNSISPEPSTSPHEAGEPSEHNADISSKQAPETGQPDGEITGREDCHATSERHRHGGALPK